MNKKKNLIINCAVIFGSVFVVLLLFEGFLVATESKHTLPQGDKKICIESQDSAVHPVFGRTYPPSSEHITKRTAKDDWDRWTINSEGFRQSHGSGEDTAIVLGDSYTAGFLADDNSTYPYLLDYWSPSTAFKNYGIGGYGTANEYLVYENKSQQIEHDTVVLQYYLGNDMRDNTVHDTKRPNFTLANDGELQFVESPKQPTETNSSSSDSGGGVLSNPYVQSVQDYLYWNTGTYNVIRTGVADLGDRGGSSSPPEPPSGEELAYQKDLTRALIEEIAAEAAANDAEVVIVVVPVRTELYPEERNIVYPPETGQQYWDTQREMLTNVSEDNPNVETLDVTPALQSEVEDGNRVSGVLNAHLNEYGYYVMASEIHDYLSDNGHVAKNDEKPRPPEVSTCS